MMFSQVQGLADKYIQESCKIITIDHTTAITSAFYMYGLAQKYKADTLLLLLTIL